MLCGSRTFLRSMGNKEISLILKPKVCCFVLFHNQMGFNVPSAAVSGSIKGDHHLRVLLEIGKGVECAVCILCTYVKGDFKEF